MQQWEYLEVRFGGHFDGDQETTQDLWADSQGRGGRFTRGEVKFTAMKLTGIFRQSEKPVGARVTLSGLSDLLNQFGGEGWELVSVIPQDSYPNASGFLLKRLMP
jgi:hypothetical protein